MNQIICLILGFMCASTFLSAQETFSIAVEDAAPAIIVTGASTLHGWKAEAGEISSYPSSLILDVSEQSVIENFGFSVTVDSLDGGRGSAMNEKIFKAFNSKENPQITFEQTTALVIPKLDGGAQVSLNVSGKIKMAGQSVDVTIPLTVELKEGVLILGGKHPLKMSDYGITPPSAMFGQIVTEDDIEVEYTFQYVKN